MIQTLRNPQQAIQMLLGQMSKSNPQMANYLNSAMQSGRNPKDILQEGIQNGTINKNTLNEVKEILNTINNCLVDLKFKI